jgi:hypothetical protein
MIPVLAILNKINKGRNKTLNKLHDKLKKILLWNGPLRLILESYLPTTLVLFSTIKDCLEWSDFKSIFSSLMALIIGSFNSIIPILVTLFFRFKFILLRSRAFLDRFGEVIGNLNFR